MFKTFFGGNLDFTKIKKLNKVCSNVWTCTKMCENYAILNQNYTLELFIDLKMAYFCCFGWRGNLDFPDFLLKSFITSTAGLILKWSHCQSEHSHSIRCYYIEQFFYLLYLIKAQDYSFLMSNTRPIFRLFSALFKQTVHLLQQINVKKCPSSKFTCWDSNPQPSDWESHPITTRPLVCEHSSLTFILLLPMLLHLFVCNYIIFNYLLNSSFWQNAHWVSLITYVLYPMPTKWYKTRKFWSKQIGYRFFKSIQRQK